MANRVDECADVAIERKKRGAHRAEREEERNRTKRTEGGRTGKGRKEEKDRNSNFVDSCVGAAFISGRSQKVNAILLFRPKVYTPRMNRRQYGEG